MLRVFKINVYAIGSHGHDHYTGCRLHARQRTHFFEILAIELGTCVLVPSIGSLKEKRQQMVRIEAFVGAP